MINNSIKFLIILLGLWLAHVPHSASAQLPPRPEPPSKSEPSPNHSSVTGAKILLTIPYDDEMTADTWTHVEWQDGDGRWHIVDGWQGTLHPNSKIKQWEVEWWVGRSDFNTGPFRWVVDPDGKRIVSEPFELNFAENAADTLRIELNRVQN